ncbi:hypothetical protein JAAARDRAFT_43031, partial [Jaapia argillacea MUCL 33604]
MNVSCLPTWPSHTFTLIRLGTRLIQQPLFGSLSHFVDTGGKTSNNEPSFGHQFQPEHVNRKSTGKGYPDGRDLGDVLALPVQSELLSLPYHPPSLPPVAPPAGAVHSTHSLTAGLLALCSPSVISLPAQY